MKRGIGALLALAAAIVFAGQASATKIGVLDWNHSEPRYMETWAAMEAELKNQGIEAEIVLKDAKGKKDNIAALVKELVAAKPDIFAALGTSAVVPLAKEVTDKPVVFGMVYDPVGAKVAASWASSGNNVTGGSNFTSIPAFLRRVIKRSGLPVKRITVLYTPGEKNSELQLAAVMPAEADLGVKVTPVTITSLEDINKWGKGVAGSADMIIMTGSNAIGTNIGAIVDFATKAKIITATHLDDLVDRGVLLGLVTDPKEVGTVAGKALAKVIKGAAPSSVAIEYPLPHLLINEKTAKAGGFKLPDDLREWAASSTAKK